MNGGMTAAAFVPVGTGPLPGGKAACSQLCEMTLQLVCYSYYRLILLL